MQADEKDREERNGMAETKNAAKGLVSKTPTDAPGALPEAAPQAKPKTAEEIERHWFEHVYAGDHQPQLTFRAVFMGMALGVVMALSNLYVGLKTGWGLGVAITACIMSYAIFKVLPLNWMQAPQRLRLFDRHADSEVSILENNCMQSTASAAGYSTGATLVSAFSAYLMITGHHLPFHVTVGLVLCLALLGVFLAIPMKRSMVNVEQLPFPSGTAAAETLRSLHAKGAESARKARSLFSAMGIGAVIAWLRDGMPGVWEKLGVTGALKSIALPAYLPLSRLFEKLGLDRLALLTSPKGYTLSVECSTILAAAGAIMGLRTAASMLLGGVVCYGVLAPSLHAHGVIEQLGYRGIVSWSVWSGVALMTSAALVNFAWEWRTIARAFSGLGGSLGSVFGRGKAREESAMDRIEVPGSWFVVGAALATVGCVIIEWQAFSVPIALGIVAVLLSSVLAIVACRATGETDVTPVGPLGKITQLAYGVLIPQNAMANLMTANVTASAASSSADLLTDLKSGYLLGANPRKQFLAQFFGVLVGAVAATGGFYLLVPTAATLGGDKFPAPAAQVWKAVAELLAAGVHALPPYALTSLFIGLALGVVLTLVEKLVPRAKRYMPSPVGFGMAFTFPAYSSVSFFIGAVAAAIYRRKAPEAAERYTVPVASGLIAGESLTGVLVAFLNVAGLL